MNPPFVGRLAAFLLLNKARLHLQEFVIQFEYMPTAQSSGCISTRGIRNHFLFLSWSNLKRGLRVTTRSFHGNAECIKDIFWSLSNPRDTKPCETMTESVFMLGKYRFSAILIAFGVLLLGAWFLKGNVVAPEVEAAKVIRGKAVDAVYATAVVEPVTWSAIAPPRTGRIAEVYAVEGQNVKKGDVLARMDDAGLGAQLQEVKALESLHETELKRAQKLADTGATAKEKLELRAANLAQTKARVSMIEEQIRQLSLTAPMDGVVLWRDIEPGEVKDANKTLFWVGLPTPLRLEAEVDEEDIPKIVRGQKALITADAFPDKIMEGTVEWISPKGDPVNKSYRVYMSLPEDTKLMIGMTVETNSIVQEKQGVLLAPAQAVTEDSFVWIIRSDMGFTTLQKMPVKKGITGEEYTEILENIQEGELIALPPFDSFSEGMRVSVKSKE